MYDLAIKIAAWQFYFNFFSFVVIWLLEIFGVFVLLNDVQISCVGFAMRTSHQMIRTFFEEIFRRFIFWCNAVQSISSAPYSNCATKLSLDDIFCDPWTTLRLVSERYKPSNFYHKKVELFLTSTISVTFHLYEKEKSSRNKLELILFW